MSKVACHYCGLPFKVGRAQPGREYFCCSGCALASRVPVREDGRFPANPALITAMVIGFVFFNQLLFWLLSVLLARQGDLPMAARFVHASLAAGSAAWAVLVAVQWRLGARRLPDVVVVLMTGGLLADGWLRGSPACAIIAGASLVAWSARGFLKKKTAGKPVDGG